jgi:hypothetical protein
MGIFYWQYFIAPLGARPMYGNNHLLLSGTMAFKTTIIEIFFERVYLAIVIKLPHGDISERILKFVRCLSELFIIKLKY